MKRLILLLALAVQAMAGQIDARFMSETLGSSQWARWRVAVDNGTTQVLSKPKVAMDVTVPSGKTPAFQGWDLGSTSLSMVQIDSVTWRVWIVSSADVAAGETWNQGNGVYFGIHLTDWSNWDASSSPGFDGNTGTWATDTMVMVWDASGAQVWGHGTNSGNAVYSTFKIIVDSGGVCNATGSVVVRSLDTLALRCTANSGQAISGWTLDGILKSSSVAMNLVGDGSDHTVEVLFKQRRLVTATITTVGQGTCQPSGQVSEYSGDTMAVSCTPDSLWMLQDVSVNGISIGSAAIVSIPVDTVDLAIHATFVASTAVGGLQVLSERDTTDLKWSKIRIRVLNNGTSTIPAGYQVVYTFRVPAHLSPAVSAWDVPSASIALDSLTNGYWKAVITSAAELAPGSEGGSGRGWYFGLSVGYSVNWDVTGDIALPTGSGWQSAPYITVHSGGTPIAGAEPSMPEARPSLVAVKAYFKEEGSQSNTFLPRVVISNISKQALSDFYFDFYIKTENGKLPILNPYYPDTPLPRLDALGNGSYRLRYDYTGRTLPPYTDLPDAAGSVFMLHYADWSDWDRTNDCSYIETSGSFLPDEGILVYEHSGKRLWGDTCELGNMDESTDTTSGFQMYPPVILVQPRDTTVAAGSSCSFEVRASGEGTLQYQWRYNGVDIPGATSATLEISLVDASMDGSGYSCVVSNEGGRTVSNIAILGVKVSTSSIYVVTQPVNDTVALGGDGSFSVVASSTDGVQYQWYHGSEPISGATSSTLSVRNVRSTDSVDGYWVQVRLGSLVVDSKQAKLVIGLGRPSSVRMTVSGTFTTASGTSPNDTAVDLLVRIYATPTGGTALWGQEILNVPVTSGKWELDLGKGKSGQELVAIAATHQGLYAAISFAGSIPSTFGTRIPLTSVPFAYQSGLRMLSGSGVPTQSAPVGMFYLNQDDLRLWRRESTGWRKLDQ
jgi:hypothetical protein